MIRPKLSLRRPLAVLGAVFLGLTAAVAVATPASAHHSEIRGNFNCDRATGEYVGSWKVKGVAPAPKYRFTNVRSKRHVGNTATDVPLSIIKVTNGKDFPFTSNKRVEEKLRVPGDTTKLSLKVKAEWDNGYKEDRPRQKSIELSGNCEQKETPPPATAKPTASVEADCDGNVIVKLENSTEATAEARFTVTGEDGFKKRIKVKPGKTDEVSVPAKNAGKITVTEKGEEEPLFDGTPDAPENCVEPGDWTGSYLSTCDELIFEIVNPEDGETVTVTFTPNKGEAQTLTVEPGKTETVKFPAEEGLTVTPSAEGRDETEPIAWEKPEECDQGGGGGGGDDLPVTGAAAGAIAAGAGVLLAVGGVLFFLARRRRVTFTA